MSVAQKNNKFYMAGTEGTGTYRVPLVAPWVGRVGFRRLGDYTRIRVEPYNKWGRMVLARFLTRETGWKQPGDGRQDRFSIVVYGSQADTIVRRLKWVLGVFGGGNVRLNRSA